MSIVAKSQIVTLLGGTLSAENDAVLTLIHKRVEGLVKKYVGYKVEQATFTEFYPVAQQERMDDLLIEGYEMRGDRAVAYGGNLGTNRILQVANLPIRSVASVYENISAWDTAGGAWPASTLLTEGPDWMVDYESAGLCWSGEIVRLSGAWARQPRSIKVTYTAGLTADELGEDGDYSEFWMAVTSSCVKFFNEFLAMQGQATGQGGVGPVVSESLANYSVSFVSNAIDKLMGMMTTLPRSAMEMLEERVRMGKFLPQ